MSGIEVNFQRASYAALRANLDLAVFVDDRVFDNVPQDSEYPFIAIGDDQLIDDSTDCGSAYELIAQVHIWSRAEGRVEAKGIASIVRDVLAVNLEVVGHVVVVSEFENARYLEDPDGSTTHGIVRFRYLIDPI